MKNIKIITLAFLAFYSSFSSANTINVISSNGAFAGNSALNLTTVSLLTTDTQIANNLNDNDAGTYFFGSSLGGTVSTATLTLEFQDTVINQSGADLAFYFMGINDVTDTINSMTACFSNGCSPTDTSTYNADLLPLGVDIGDGDIYALSVITFDLSDFGFASGEALDQFSIDIIAGDHNRLSGIDTITAVPLPAPLLLFISGLSLFGWFGRRK